MFTPTDLPRVYGLPCGVDVAHAVVSGLRERLADAPPQAMARVELIVNAERMAQRVRAAFDAGPPGLLPRIRLVTDCADLRDVAHLPMPVPSLRRRLEVMQLVGALLEAQPDLAPRSARYDLADQLVRIYDEMVDEGVSPDVLAGLDTTDQSGHWARALTFLQIVRPFVEGDDMDAQTHMRRGIEARIARWQDNPPDHPVIVAGSTGSRGTTRLLMEAVARLPQGAVILPGVDPHMPGDVWQGLEDALVGEDHPQFRFARVCQALGRDPTAIADWAQMQPPSVARNRVVSLALRPAPVTDQWLRDGPGLPDLPDAMADVTLLEAAGPRDEALTIAWRLRHAAQAGETAALVTPDRMLSRRVSAALDRWGLVANDSAGLGLHLSAPGRLMRQLGDLLHRPVTAEALIALLKHPLTHAGPGKEAGRGPHLLWTRDLELYVRRQGIPFPGEPHLQAWAAQRKDATEAAHWAKWVLAITPGPVAGGERPAADWVARHVAWAEQVVAGSCGAEPSALWAEEEGKALRRVVGALAEEAARAGDLAAQDYADMMTALLRGEDIRERVTPHPRIFIWGTIEVRAMGVDLLILAGLNEGSWPAMPAADPWLNRRLRHEAGLLLPDRRIGLSAHDFQQAVAAPKVWLTRARRTEEAETVPARWLNRLVNLLQGLPARRGPEALGQMRARAAGWQRAALRLERAIPSDPAPRPAPVPPVASRPARLSVTEIKTLIRDPFAIYAKHVLRLRPLNPLQRAPDYLLRGIVLHTVVEDFIKRTCADSDALRADVLSAMARDVLARDVDWPAIRPLWQARVDRMAARFVIGEARRQQRATPTAFERRGSLRLPDLGFELVGKLDRIDVSPEGAARVYDYKTGAPPTEAVQRAFDKQLLLEAAMIETGGIEGMGPMPVVEATYLGLGPDAPEVSAPLNDIPAMQTCADLAGLIGAYRDAAQGYPARNAIFSARDEGDYDHLARYGEWDESQSPVKVVLT